MILALLLAAQLRGPLVPPAHYPPCSADVKPGALCIWQTPNVHLYQQGDFPPAPRPAWAYVKSEPERFDAFDSRALIMLELWKLKDCNPSDSPERIESGGIINCMGYK